MSTIEDTAAWKITRQLVDHIFGSDTDVSDDEFIFIYRVFLSRGGSWKDLMDGDTRIIIMLQKVLEDFFKVRAMKDALGVK